MKKNVQFLLVFTAMLFCCGHVLGHTGTHYGRAKAVNQTGGGKVYASVNAVSLDTVTGWVTEAGSSACSAVYNCGGNESNDKHTFHYYAQCTDDTKEFYGWFNEAGCTTLKSELTHYEYEGSVNGGENNPNDITLYAKFDAKRYYYYASLKAVSGNVEAGMVYVDESRSAALPEDITNYKNEITSASKVVKTTEASGVCEPYYAGAKAARGWKFSNWTASSPTEGFDSSEATKNASKYKITTSVQSADAPQIGIVTANFAENTDFITVTVLKDANKGTVTIKYKDCLRKNSAGTGLEKFDIANTSTTADESYAQQAYKDVDNIVLTATPASGYKFLGWYKSDKSTLITSDTEYSIGTKSDNQVFYAAFIDENDKFLVGSRSFSDLTDACNYADTSANKKIVVIEDVTLSSGSYTIPEGATLLIPKDDQYQAETIGKEVSSFTALSQYRKLTLTGDATIYANGSICVSANQYGGSNNIPGPGSVSGAYGCIDMSTGGHIVVNSGGKLYAQGFIFGSGNQANSGTITIKDGGEVYENIVIQDMHGGGGSAATVNGQKASNDYELFPFNQYYIQNIEPKMTIEFGGAEKVAYDIVASGLGKHDYCNFIGSASDNLFSLSDNSSVTKWYDAERDYQCFSLSGTVNVNELSIYISGSIGLISSKFILPLTNNMDIDIQAGSIAYISKPAKMLPGSRVYVAEGATFNLTEALYLYDYQDWDKFAMGYYVIPMSSQNSPNVVNHATLKYSGKVIGKRFTNDKSTLGNAQLIIDGEVNVTGNGAFYTTGEGASILSTHSGNIQYEIPAKEEKIIYEIWGTYGKKKDGTALAQGQTDAAEDQVRVGSYSFGKQYYTYGTPVDCTPAKLLNGDGSYTSSNTSTNFSFKYEGTGAEGKWVEYAPAKAVVEENKEFVITDETPMEQVQSITVNEGGSVKVETEVEKEITIANGGYITVESGKSAEVSTLALNASPADIFTEDEDNYTGESSQVVDEGTLTVTNAYIDIQMDPRGTMNSLLWYTFAVPFNANIANVQKMDKDGKLSAAVLNTDYRVYTYDGANRAQYGSTSSNNWVQVTTSTDGGKFIPGKFYLVEFNSNSYNTYRFTKSDGNLNNAANLPIAANVSQTGSDKDGGWNAIANTALKDAKISVANGVTEAQVFNPISRKFETVVLSNTTFAIATGLFIQATAASTANNTAVKAATPAPARMLAATEEKTFGTYTLRISQNEAKYTDQLLFSASENASSSYVIGKDLTKMFMGNATVAQMWINDYNCKLTKNQAVMVNDIAEASLSLYAPNAGEYNVYLKDIPEDATIYLLKNGEAIANLNEGAYKVTLSAGENAQYGLRINAIKTVPGVYTSIDEALVSGELQKVLLDGVVYIVRDGKLITVLGQER